MALRATSEDVVAVAEAEALALRCSLDHRQLSLHVAAPLLRSVWDFAGKLRSEIVGSRQLTTQSGRTAGSARGPDGAQHRTDAKPNPGDGVGVVLAAGG